MGASELSENHLIPTLPAAEAQPWLPFPETVDMPLGISPL